MQRVLLEYRMIYLDHASSSRPEPKFVEAAQAMLPRFFANPSATHMLGYSISKKMEESKKKIANALGFEAEEVFFTASGSEAVNMGIKGIAFANQHKGKHLITFATEHHAVLESMKQLRDYFGFELTILPVNREGEVDVELLLDSIKPSTILIAIMAVNNEIGTIAPLCDIQKRIMQVAPQVILFVDAIAAVGKIDLSLLCGDVLAISQHKLGGLSGSGCLLKKKHISLLPLLSGGTQEGGLRAGTPFAIANILFGEVLENAIQQEKIHKERMQTLKEYLTTSLINQFNVKIVSHQNGSPYIVSFILNKGSSSIIMNGLSQQEVYVSTQSACASLENPPSHVLLACGYTPEQANAMIRVSFHYDTSQEDIDGFLQAYEKVKHYVQ